MMKTTRVLALVGMAAVLFASGARLVAEPSPIPRFDWVFDDTVRAMARVGNTFFIGGGFRSMLPTAGAVGNLYALSPATGALVPTVIPRLDEEATAVTADGSGGYFVAGTFTSVGPGSPSGNVVHIRSDGSVDPSFVKPAQVSGVPSVMARVGPSLVMGPLRVSGVTRPLVALDAATGALSPWVPALPLGDTNVWDVESANGILFAVSGAFLGAARYVTAFDGVTGTLLWQSDVAGAPGFSGVGQLALAGGRLIVALGRLYSLDPVTGVVDPAWATGHAPTSSVLTMSVGGGAIYVGGTFTSFHGQPRAHLAAVDLATGALLPWQPQSSESVFDLTASATGTVFVAARFGITQPMTINGQARRAVFEIDATGAVTAFASEAGGPSASLLHLASNGTLLVSGEPGFAGVIARAGLAEIDITTGNLLPPTIALSLNGGPAALSAVVARGDVLYLLGAFDTVNGQPRNRAAAVDVPTGTVLPWPAPGVTLADLLFEAGRHLYFSIPGAAGAANHRRVDAITGVIDLGWLPSVSGTLHYVGGELVRIAPGPPGGCNSGAVLGSLDPVTGAFREWFRTTAYNGGLLTADGDTLYVAGNVPNPQGGGCYVGAVLFAYDRRTFTPVSAPPAAGAINGLNVADGRLVVSGFDLLVGGSPFSGVIEVPRPTAVGGFRQTGLSFGLNAGRPSDVFGDLLVGQGFVSRRSRVAGFRLLGAQAPSNLRTRSVGGAVEFTWDAPASPPPGGYVLEAGLAAGQTAAALPVGASTTFATPVAVPGPVFVRIRTQGGAEVSNEVVVGCVAPPRAPTALTTTLNGTSLTLSWTAPNDDVLGYTLLGGSAAGLSDAATVVGGPQTFVSGSVPGGTFFARVTAFNACGTSGPSGEVFFTIGAPDPLPAAPTNLVASVSGSTASLTWTAPAGAVTSYVLEAGTAAGLANLGTLAIGATPSLVIPGVPAGTYMLRVRAVTSAGSGAPSADVVVVVP